MSRLRNVIGLVSGFVLGCGGALLLTPAPGVDTRRALKTKIRDVANIPREKAQKAAELAKEKAGDLGSRVGREAAEAAVEAAKEDILGRNKTA